MSVFENYAYYYNLLYHDKDYQGEADFVHQLIQTYAPKTKSILELGCGTGNHALLLAKRGYHLHGVDFSSKMLEKAQERISNASVNFPKELESRVNFSQGDIRNLNLEKKFDTIISLFHVISYQTTNIELKSTFNSIKKHLKSGGICIFDCWYGPTVLTDTPTIRIKRLEDNRIYLTRIAEPTLYPNDNLVDVNYQIFIKEKQTGKVDEIKETHKMRYLFKPEIELLCLEFDLKIVQSKEWMSNKEPGLNTWGVYFILRG